MKVNTEDPALIAPWRAYDDVRKMSQNELNLYYDKIYNGQNGLSPIQKQCIDNHTADVQDSARAYAKSLLLKRSPAYAVLRYLGNVIGLSLHSFLNNFMLPFTDPVNWAYAVVAYTGIFVGLFAMQIAFAIMAPFTKGKEVKVVETSFFQSDDKINAVRAALRVLGSPPPFIPLPPDPNKDARPSGKRNQHLDARTRKEKILFDVDVAKAMLILSGLVYARETDWVLKAKSYPWDTQVAAARNAILRSEELMYSTAKRFGLEFTSISDFSAASGAFVGAFWKIDGLEKGQHPFVIIVFKGTTPTSVTEWAVDGSFKLESASDYFGAGSAHEGFLCSVFPAPSTYTTAANPSNPLKKMRIIPYKRITNTIKLIGQEAASRTKLSLQVFVAGHSLGAGMASLFYARLLESPHDVDVPDRELADGTVVKGIDADVRDAYVFGCPRSCSADLASRVDYNLRRPENFGRMLFRVCNKDLSPRYGDVVTHVPPGLCDERRFRGTIRAGSLLSYAAIGLRIDLTPTTHIIGPTKDRHFRLGPVPLGAKVEVVSRLPASERVNGDNPRPPLDWWNRLLPWVADHMVIGYWWALTQVQPKYVELETDAGVEKTPAKQGS